MMQTCRKHDAENPYRLVFACHARSFHVPCTRDTPRRRTSPLPAHAGIGDARRAALSRTDTRPSRFNAAAILECRPQLRRRNGRRPLEASVKLSRRFAFSLFVSSLCLGSCSFLVSGPAFVASTAGPPPKPAPPSFPSSPVMQSASPIAAPPVAGKRSRAGYGFVHWGLRIPRKMAA